LHQFDKVEIVRVEHPDNSYKALDGMRTYKRNSKRIEITIQNIASLEAMGFTSALTYDFEVFSAQDRWLEISSVSNSETFQANRLKLRFKDKDGKKMHIHKRKFFGLTKSFGRILENYQTADGIVIPKFASILRI
jgi:seryl-tRNA synthetase